LSIGRTDLTVVILKTSELTAKLFCPAILKISIFLIFWGIFKIAGQKNLADLQISDKLKRKSKL
jgi:hypothetical protein